MRYCTSSSTERKLKIFSQNGVLVADNVVLFLVFWRCSCRCHCLALAFYIFFEVTYLKSAIIHLDVCFSAILPSQWWLLFPTSTTSSWLLQLELCKALGHFCKRCPLSMVLFIFFLPNIVRKQQKITIEILKKICCLFIFC